MTEDFKSYYFDLIKKYYKTIPCWVNYLAVDANGYVCGYNNPPQRHKHDARWVMPSTDGSEATYLFCITRAYPIDWENTLIDLKKFAKKEYIKQIKEHINAFPDWVKYVVMDNQGYVSGYEYKPEIDGLSWKASARCSVVFQMIEFANYVYFADTLVNIKDIITRKDYNPILIFKYWETGNTTLVGNIIEVKNIPANTNNIHYSIMDAFLYDDGRKGLIINSSVYRTPKDMVMIFKTSYERTNFIHGLINNIKTVFGGLQCIEATKDDIGKDVYIDGFYGSRKGILKAITTEGKYAVEDDELRIIDKAYIRYRNKYEYKDTIQSDGSHILEFKGYFVS